MSDPVFYLTVEAELEEVTRYLTAMEREQIPFAASWALNRTAYKVRRAIQDDMRRIFNRPTRYSLNQVGYTKTNKRDLRSTVYIESPDLGPSHLRVHIDGGVRPRKRSEQQLGMSGVLPAGLYTVPSSRLLTASGKVSGSRLVQIISGVRGFQSGLSMNLTEMSAARNPNRARWFVVQERRGRTRHLAPGIWERTKAKPRPALMFTRPPLYSKRFPFYDLADRHTRRLFPDEIRAALKRAIATSTRKTRGSATFNAFLADRLSAASAGE